MATHGLLRLPDIVLRLDADVERLGKVEEGAGGVAADFRHGRLFGWRGWDCGRESKVVAV